LREESRRGRSASDKEAAGFGVESLETEAIGNCNTPNAAATTVGAIASI